MKAVAMVFLCVAVCASAQQKERFGQYQDAAPGASACGPGGAAFKVRLKNSPSAPVPPAAGQAQVVFIHDAGDEGAEAWGNLAYPTSKYALDGGWVGANHGDSWFSVAVPPGEHHVCVALQSSIVDPRTELAHFTAVAGQSYYFRTRLVMSRQVELLDLEPIDSDEGKYLTQVYPHSESAPKK